MKRTQFYLGEELDSRLRDAAAAEGRSAAAIVRDAVQAYLSQRPRRGRKDPFDKFVGAFESRSSQDHDAVIYGVGKQ